MAHILVTGGAGYIGSTVASQLIAAGHDVTIIDNLSRNGRLNLPAGVRFLEADINRLEAVISKEDGIDAVMHFAAYMAAGESMQDPDLYWRNNTEGSLALMRSMRRLGIKNLIFSSTAAVYGDPERLPIDESAATRPTNTYGATKLAVDMAITSYCQAYGMAAVSLRYFNVAGAALGPDGSAVCGERHEPETHLIPLALAAAHRKEASFTLFGGDYPTEDGTCIRDYIHVSDLADAHLLALGHLDAGRHAIYNLGNGNGFSNRQVLEAVSRVTGHPMDILTGPRRPGDPAALVASSRKAQEELGWKPRKPAIDDIVKDAWAFYRLTDGQKTA